MGRLKALNDQLSTSEVSLSSESLFLSIFNSASVPTRSVIESCELNVTTDMPPVSTRLSYAVFPPQHNFLKCPRSCGEREAIQMQCRKLEDEINSIMDAHDHREAPPEGEVYAFTWEEEGPTGLRLTECRKDRGGVEVSLLSPHFDPDTPHA